MRGTGKMIGGHIIPVMMTPTPIVTVTRTVNYSDGRHFCETIGGPAPMHCGCYRHSELDAHDPARQVLNVVLDYQLTWPCVAGLPLGPVPTSDQPRQSLGFRVTQEVGSGKAPTVSNVEWLRLLRRKSSGMNFVDADRCRWVQHRLSLDHLGNRDVIDCACYDTLAQYGAISMSFHYGRSYIDKYVPSDCQLIIPITVRDTDYWTGERGGQRLWQDAEGKHNESSWGGLLLNHDPLILQLFADQRQAFFDLQQLAGQLTRSASALPPMADVVSEFLQIWSAARLDQPGGWMERLRSLNDRHLLEWSPQMVDYYQRHFAKTHPFFRTPEASQEKHAPSVLPKMSSERLAVLSEWYRWYRGEIKDSTHLIVHQPLHSSDPVFGLYIRDDQERRVTDPDELRALTAELVPIFLQLDRS